jgi:cation-transporting ATPase E
VSETLGAPPPADDHPAAAATETAVEGTVVDHLVGLDEAAVRDRVSRGDVNEVPSAPTRTVAQIFRANIFTRFNAILGALLVVIIIVGPFQDALFGVVLVANAAIGIVQELRAKRTLDQLAVLSAPHAAVVRGGEVRDVAAHQVVLDDVLELAPGDQVLVDGLVLTGDLELDESLLSGEADPMPKSPGDEVLSGSFVTAGNGRYRATRVGRANYASALAEEARRFTLVRSELRDGINQILRLVQWVIPPAAALLIYSQLQHADLEDSVRGSVAGVGSMIPEGLVLLTSLAFALAVIRLGRRRVLVQELAAVEGLARVDVACLDKTGTLTEGVMEVSDVEVLAPELPIGDALGALAAADPQPNASLQAVGRWAGEPAGWAVSARAPFSSARKWGAATFDGRGTWLLGAPDILLASVPDRSAARQADEHARQGRRVLLLAQGDGGGDTTTLPASLTPAALVVLDERVRADASGTIGYFGRQGVTVKIISGDNPTTVGAIARRVGVPGAEQPVDGRALPSEPGELAQAVEEHSVFGRINPHQKRAMVSALQSRDHVVAMTGDGVNDVLALKDADIGMAMGSGSSATRAVSQLVLLDNAFDVVPGVVAEGRRVIANVERVANLFVTKTVYAVLLAIAVGAATLHFPFLPRHLTVVSGLTIGIPAFFLALGPNSQRWRPGFVNRVLRFALPSGLVAATATFIAYAVARGEPSLTLTEARTTATIVLFSVGLWVLVILMRPFTRGRLVLVIGMAVAFAGALTIPGIDTFFELQLPAWWAITVAVVIAVLADVTLEVGWRVAGWWQRRGPPAVPS